MSQVLSSLTDAQQEAVTHIDGPLLVIAGPGSGKTRVITHRIAYMLEKAIPDYRILALTFTNKASGEMRERLVKLVGQHNCLISTFHSMSARLLRQYAPLVGFTKSFSIYDSQDSLNIIKGVIKTLNYDTSAFKAPAVRHQISNYKNDFLSPATVTDQAYNFYDQRIAKIYERYQEELTARNSMDFDDLLINMLKIVSMDEVRDELQDRFRYILVDEYQDTNHVQYLIVKELASKYRNLCCTGDPDQSIYGWRGADISNILDFEKDFPDCKVVKLEQNYRSTQTILRAADSLIRFNTQRKEKDLYTENEDGYPLEMKRANTEKDESRMIVQIINQWIITGMSPSEIAVFYRVNSLSRNIEEYFRYYGIPYSIVGGVEFYQRMEIKDILAYGRLVQNPWDSASFLRIINTPRRGMGKSTIETLKNYCGEQRVSYIEALEDPKKIPDLKGRAQKATEKFRDVILEIQKTPTFPVAPFFKAIMDETEYETHLTKNFTGEDLIARMANMRELLTAADEYDLSHPEGSLLEFLEGVSLMSDVDQWEDQAEKVTLMTLHASKGLEFGGVIIAGCEDGLLPHSLSKDTPEKIEEERRLLYVGITRAKERLVLSHARLRNLWGKSEFQIPSPFLEEIQEGMRGR